MTEVNIGIFFFSVLIVGIIAIIILETLSKISDKKEENKWVTVNKTRPMADTYLNVKKAYIEIKGKKYDVMVNYDVREYKNGKGKD